MPKKSYFACIFPWLLTIFIQNLCFCGAEQRPSPRPIVLLPSFFHWEATNRIFVSPTPISGEEESVDISVRVQGENENGQKNELFFERQKSTRGICAFKVFIPKKDPSGGLLNNFYIKVEVSGHRLFDSVLAGTSDLRQMFIQTDKVFYRPGERVNVRALPLTSNGLLYTGPIQFQLLDQKSFRIFNKTSGSKSAQTDGTNNDHRKEKTEGFLAEHFDLPKFLRFGEWKIVAFAVEHTGQREMVTSNRFQRSINVREYIAPKFHVFLDLVETITTMSVKSVVSARFAHGMPVSGELTLRCSSPNALNISEGPSNGDQSAAFLHSQKKLLSTEIIAGIWSGKLDLSNCLGENRRSSRILISAEVFERGTLQAAKTQRDFDPFWSAFELLRPLSSLQFVINGRAEMVAQCISEDKALNGLNQSSFHKLGTMAELEIKPGCIVYIIRARRELPNGNFSIAESLIIPSLNGTKALDFSLIADQTPQNRVDYFEGEVLEARVPSGSDLNYAMICNGGRDIILVEKVGQDGRILIPISARMRSGPCVLYVFGKENEFVLDMRLFFVHTERCPDQRVNFHIVYGKVQIAL
uniref:C2 domain-containing protein n=1 Tax=Globodera pallida TaxID=36090 RepID=A0A183C717_GLOPA